MNSRSIKFSVTVTISLLLLLMLFLPVLARGEVAAPIAPRPRLAVEAVNTYVFSYTTATYTEITGTTSTATGDDGAQNLTLPFTFRYDGTNYTTARVSTNGWLELGTAFTGSGFTNDLASTSNKPLLAPLWDDLYDDATSVISYTTQGIAPDRIFVIQWKGIRWQLSSGTPQNFQVRLYETSNVVEFVYGTMTAPSTPSASIGINDATGGSGHYLSVTPANPPTVSSTTANNSIAAITFLPSGTVYRFTPPPPAPDFSVSTKTVSPTGTRFTGDVLTYTIGLVNSGDLTSTVTTLSDPIPAGTTYVPGSAQLTGSGTLTPTGSSIDWTGGLGLGERITVTFQVTLTAVNGSVTNTAAISDPLISAAVVKSASNVVAVPNYNTSTKVVSAQVHPGQRATYTVTLINSGLVTGTSATLSDPIPAGATYVDSSAQVAGGGILTATASSIDWNGSIAPSGRVTITFQVTLTALSGSVVNSATINDPLLLTPVVKLATTAIQPPTGGPDGGGYTYKDSYTAGGPTFTWVLTTGASTLIPSFTGTNDDGYAQIPLGFDFRFYTGVYSQPFVSTNGLVSFGAGSSELSNATIPTASSPNNYATCFWDDQQILAGQGIWYETFGVAPNRYAVVTWLVQDYNSGTLLPPYQYQIILYEGTGQILCQYLSMTGAADGDGKSATIGMENATGTTGVLYAYNKTPGPIEDNLAILFSPGPAYTSSTKTVQPTGAVNPGQVLTYTVVVSNSGLVMGTPTLLDPIPAGTTYVPGSAQVVGGGALLADSAGVTWTGTLTDSLSVNVTFQVTVTAIGGSITNTATITDPLSAPVIKTASNTVLCDAPAGASFIYDPLAPLSGQSIDFTGSVLTGTPPLLYTWDFADGTPIGAGNPITHSYAVSGSYGVGMTVVNACGTTSYTQTVGISDAATPPSLGPLQSSSPTALGNATYFTGTLLAGSTPITYTWDFGDGTIVNDGLIINHTYAAGTYTAILTATNVAGQAVVTTTVDVGAGPTASFDNNSPVNAPNTTVVFTYTGANTTAWLWDFGDSLTSTLPSPTHTYAMPPAQTTKIYTVTLTAANAYGAVQISAPVTVTNYFAVLSGVKLGPPALSGSGSLLVYTIRVTNTGGLPAGNTSLVDTFPIGATGPAIDVTVSQGSLGTNTASGLTWNGALAGGESLTLTFSLTPTVACGGQVLTNTAVISDPAIAAPLTLTAAGTQLVGSVTLSEGFDNTTFPPAGWSTAVVTDTGTYDTPAWSRVTSGSNPLASPHSGAAMTKFNSYDADSGDAARLATPALDFSTVAYPILQFWMYHDTAYTSAADRIQVQASTDGGTTYTNVGAAVTRYDGSVGWKLHTVDLLTYGGVNGVRVAFLGIGAYGNNIFMDDVAIVQPCAGVTIGPDQSGTACAGSQTVYTLTVNNNTASADTINLTLQPASPTWATVVQPSALALSANGSGLVTVTVNVPSSATPGSTDGVTVTATGQTSGFVDHASIQTMAKIATGWEDRSASPLGVRYAAVVYNNGALYQIGGQSSTAATSAVSATYRYDIAANTWYTMTSMPDSVYGIDAVSVGGNVYVFGGTDGTFYRDYMQIYSTTANTWLQGAPLGLAYLAYDAVVVDGKIYVIGGQSGTTTPVITNTVLMYDPATDSWTLKAPLTTPRYHAMAAAIGGKIYVAGGSYLAALNSVEIYDPASDTWTAGASMPQAWAAGSDSVLYNRYLLVTGGGGTPATASNYAWLYDTVLNTWSPFPALNSIRYGAEADGDGTQTYMIAGREYDGSTFFMSARNERLVNTCETCVSPSATFTYAPAAPQVNQPITFTAVATGTSPFTYSWNFGDGSAAGSGNPIGHSYATIGTFQPTLTATNQCGSAVYSTMVTVLDTPIVGLTASNSSPTQLGQATFLTATISSGNNVTYTWDFGDTTSGVGDVTSHFYQAGGVFTATVTAANGVSTTLASTVVTIVALDPTTTTLASSVNPSVFGQTVTFTATVEPIAATGAVQFYADGNPLAGVVAVSNGTAQVSTAALSVGAHVITATYSGDVSYLASTAAPLNQVVESTATCFPITGTNFNFVPSMPTTGRPVNFTAVITSGTPPITYTWNFGQGADVITTTTGVVHSFPLTNTTQSYTVTLAAANVCSSPVAVSKLVAVQPVRVYLPLILK